MISHDVVELDARNVLAYLRLCGLLAPDAAAEADELGGGISNVVLRVRTEGDCMVLKQSLPQLRVTETWEFDRSRILVERDCLLALAELLPEGHAPVVRFVDAANFVLVMSCAPPGRMWKQVLLDGEVDQLVACRVGELVGQMQARAARGDALPRRLESMDVLHQGRIDPYHRAAARAHPDLADVIETDIARLTGTGRTLVLGDLSPKNILITPERVLLLDFEVAHWGDPAFDPAFLLSHLVLKAVHLPAHATKLLTAAVGFWGRYQAWVPSSWSPDLERGAALELGCLLLARVDGKSKAEYLTEPEREVARDLGHQLLTHPSPDPLDALTRVAVELRLQSSGRAAEPGPGRP